MTCGCVFRANYDEYHEAHDAWSITSSICPQCGNMAVVHQLAGNEKRAEYDKEKYRR